MGPDHGEVTPPRSLAEVHSHRGTQLRTFSCQYFRDGSMRMLGMPGGPEGLGELLCGVSSQASGHGGTRECRALGLANQVT